MQSEWDDEKLELIEKEAKKGDFIERPEKDQIYSITEDKIFKYILMCVFDQINAQASGWSMCCKYDDTIFLK